jgi:hypothetical protein
MIRPIYNPFSKYADRLEKRLDSFLGRISGLGIFEIQRKLIELMQENLVVVNLWMEYKFRGYKYLRKGARRKMYRNAEEIGQKFLAWEKARVVDGAQVQKLLVKFKVNFSQPDLEKLIYLLKICEFLSGKNSSGAAVTGQMGAASINKNSSAIYQYLEGASFGKLLVDIDREKMIGDCNQIVTFYAYLFALKHDLKELQIKVPPEHVCLHFKGVDIEATNGSLQKYDNGAILPIAELISTNLLDVSDFRDKKNEIKAEEFLKGARLAFNVSSNRELVEKNLKVAYHNAGVEAARRDDFENAILLLEKSQESTVLAQIFHNAIVHFVKIKKFSSARFYLEKAQKSPGAQSGLDVAGLQKFIWESEGENYYERGDLTRARELFVKAGNQAMVKATYAKEYNKLQSRVAGYKNLLEMKPHKNTFRKMLDLAIKMEDANLTANLRDLLNKM